ncbi:hypothetical protein STTU_6141 [Streptomyces sp. Tu6071]|nr:hypothetical protein STTU_6141 [Streptomyces sp. Tu6071]
MSEYFRSYGGISGDPCGVFPRAGRPERTPGCTRPGADG